MAAGDIILSDGTTITPEDLQKIAAETKKLLAAESKELSQYEEVSSLSNLTSLPGIFQSGSTMKLVRVALSVLKGVDGKTVELSASSTAIQWRYVGETEWNTLIDIALLKGDRGDAGEKIVLRKGQSGIEWKYESEEDTAYKTLVSIDDIKLKYSDLSEVDKAELTKKPILAKVNAQSGSTAYGSFASDGEDENGNPKYILNLTVQKGDKGEPPVFEVGSVTTGLPSSEASVELTPNGETPEGNPKYLMNISIPKGEPGQNGTGSGNVYVTETGLEAGKTYLFRPSAPNSASGTFVLYEAPDTSQFITNTVNNLVNYYLKAETYSREEVNSLLGQMSSINFKVVDELPASGESNLIYLVKKEGSGNDIHDEYIWVEGKWEIIGSTAVDLTNYYTKTDVDGKFALKADIENILTKESIEKILTGNIESHTHKTTYQLAEIDTDTWDGSSESSTLQGDGTEQNPFQINSCADWVHFIKNGSIYCPTSEDPQTAKYMVINKNLDFDGHTLDLSHVFAGIVNSDSQVTTMLYAFLNIDGKGAAFKNFIVNGWSILGIGQGLSCQNIGMEGTVVYDLDIIDEALSAEPEPVVIAILPASTMSITAAQETSGALMYGPVIGNSYSKLKVKIKATKQPSHVNISDGITAVNHLLANSHPINSSLSSNIIIGDSKNYYMHVDYELENTGTPFLLPIMSMGNIVATEGDIKGYCYDTTETKNINSEMQPSVETGLAVLHVGCAKDGSITANISDVYKLSSPIDETLAGTMDVSTPKTLDEMKQSEFLDLLNGSGDNKWRADIQQVNNGLPVPNNIPMTIVYDGYVAQSEFEEWKKNHSVPDTGDDAILYKLSADALIAYIEKESGETADDLINVFGSSTVLTNLFNDIKQGKNVQVVAESYANTTEGSNALEASRFWPIYLNIGKTDTQEQETYLVQMQWIRPNNNADCNISSICFFVQNGTFVPYLKEDVLLTKDAVTFPSSSGSYYVGTYSKWEETLLVKPVTQSEYDSISPKDNKTLYVITE